MRRTRLALLLPLTAACGASPPAATTPRVAEDAMARPPTGESAGLELTEKGIAQLTGAPMTQEGLTGALPGYTVEHVPEGEYQEEHFLVKAGAEPILEIRFSGDETQRKLRSVDIVSPVVGTHLGVAIGTTHADATRKLGAFKCTDGGEEADHREALVVCTTPRQAHLVFEFMDADEDGSPRRQASEVLEDEPGLAASKLVTITWSPE